MLRHSFRISTILLVLVFASATAFADGYDRAGTAAAPELLIPVGARDMALGGASIATSSGLEALHWNPAGLSKSESNAGILFSTMSYLADTRINYLATGANFKSFGSLALNIKALDFGQIPVTTEANPDGTGADFSPTFFTLGLTFAKELTDRIAVGFTSHYIVNRILRVEATAASFSAGLQYANLGGIAGLDLGVALKHIGTRMQFGGSGLLRRGQLNELRRGPSDYNVEASSADLPSTFELGLSYRYMDALNLSSVFRHNNFAYDQYRMGAEYVLSDFFALRAGFDYAPNSDDDYIYGTSFGFGLNLDAGRSKICALITPTPRSSISTRSTPLPFSSVSKFDRCAAHVLCAAQFFSREIANEMRVLAGGVHRRRWIGMSEFGHDRGQALYPAGAAPRGQRATRSSLADRARK